MFNLKEIAALKSKNDQLQQQLNLVTKLLQLRQDDVVRLQRELLNLRQQPQSKLPTDFYSELQSKVEKIVDSNGCNVLTTRLCQNIGIQVVNYLKDILEPDSEPELEPDSEDEDEDEDEDD